MEFRQLRSFAAAACCGSFTRAARTLGITQAAISQHVAALEREFNVRLFERGKRAVRLTPLGEQLHKLAQQILALHDEARLAMVGAPPEPGGLLRIAASAVPAEVLLPAWLEVFRHRHPEVREQVTVADSETVLRAVEDEAADVGFVEVKPSSKKVTVRPLERDELVLVVAPSHPQARKPRLKLADLVMLPLILREAGSATRDCVLDALDAAGLPAKQLTVAMEINTSDAIRTAVLRGMGAAFLSRATIRQELADGALIELRVQGVSPHRRLYLIRPKSQSSWSAVEAFLAAGRDGNS